MTKKIVNGVSRFQENHPQSGELVDRVRVHYTDSSTKDFNVVEWEMTLSEGRRL